MQHAFNTLHVTQREVSRNPRYGADTLLVETHRKLARGGESPLFRDVDADATLRLLFGASSIP